MHTGHRGVSERGGDGVGVGGDGTVAVSPPTSAATVGDGDRRGSEHERERGVDDRSDGDGVREGIQKTGDDGADRSTRVIAMERRRRRRRRRRERPAER